MVTSPISSQVSEINHFPEVTIASIIGSAVADSLGCWRQNRRARRGPVAGSVGRGHVDRRLGNNHLTGEDGSDHLRVGAGYDSLSGGANTDFSVYDGLSIGYTLTQGALINHESSVEHTGNAAANALAGTSEADRNYATGNDTGLADGGDELVEGGDCDDSLMGSDPAETINGGADNDTIDGQAGNDKMIVYDAQSILLNGVVFPDVGAGQLFSADGFLFRRTRRVGGWPE